MGESLFFAMGSLPAWQTSFKPKGKKQVHTVSELLTKLLFDEAVCSVSLPKLMYRAVCSLTSLALPMTSEAITLFCGSAHFMVTLVTGKASARSPRTQRNSPRCHPLPLKSFSGPNCDPYNPNHDPCSSENRFPGPSYDPCNPTHDPCNPKINFCNPKINFCNPKINFCNPKINFCNPKINFCNPIIESSYHKISFTS